jgi:hypothetical protein
MIRELFTGLLFIPIFGLFNIVGAQDDNFGYENWPGKNGAIKGSIELPVDPFLGYELQLKPGFNDSTLRFNLPIPDDTIKIGKLEIKIYKTIKDAQLALLDFLYAMQSPFKPPRLTSEEFSPGDVAFGSKKDEIFFVLFTHANVRVILTAPARVATELAQKVDSLIQAATAWAPGDPKPHFIITMEFLKAFSVKTQ